MMKTCIKCNKEKELNCFEGNRKKCKDCRNEEHKQYRLEHKDEIKTQRKEYRETHKEEIREDKKEYYENNKERLLEQKKEYKRNNKDKVNKRRRIYIKERKNKDPAFALRKIITNGILGALKAQGSSKQGQSVLKYLPYKIEELVAHLEKQFKELGNEWMNWGNWGKYNVSTWDDDDQSTWTWNLDHRTAQSKLPFASIEDKNFQKCWALKNLRPYSAKQNVIDGNRR